MVYFPCTYCAVFVGTVFHVTDGLAGSGKGMTRTNPPGRGGEGENNHILPPKQAELLNPPPDEA